MNKITIGKNGNQPFAIKAKGVSGIHASLTITDDGVWMLKDENSTNGTFIKDTNGDFERIEVKRIESTTFIRLGDETVNGICFQASQLLKADQNDYTMEFHRLRKHYAELQEAKYKIQRKRTITKFIPLLISFICIIISIPFDSPKVMRALMVLPSLFTSLIKDSYTNDNLKLNAKYKKILVCPKCGKNLSEYEITKGLCSGCKAHC